MEIVPMFLNNIALVISLIVFLQKLIVRMIILFLRLILIDVDLGTSLKI